MMSGANRDAFTVKEISHFLRGNAVQHERKNAGLLLGRANDVQPWDALQDLKDFLNSKEEVAGVIALDLMRPPPPCLTPGQRLLDVLPLVMKSELRNIPVVSTLSENQLVGSLSRAQVLTTFSEAIAEKSDPTR